MDSCAHSSLTITTSPHAITCGYKRTESPKRRAAATLSRAKRDPSSLETDQYPESTFPAPLILPNDDLALDPKYPGQSLLSWTRLKERNQITNRRKTIYVASPPIISNEVKHAQNWSTPKLPTKSTSSQEPLLPPSIDNVITYLSSFFHPLPVIPLSGNLTYQKWSSKPSESQYLSLSHSSSTTAIQVRTRKSPNKNDQFTNQVNLNDILDLAIEILPQDAYALIILEHNDLYEDENDDFCCGRAYGGSRVSVVSSARYHPSCDDFVDVDREHSWPASHCTKFLDDLCFKGQDSKTKKVKVSKTIGSSSSSSPMLSALATYTSSLKSNTFNTNLSLQTLWLSRLCKTASHELLHCFGVDHCIYYSCIMQGTASLAEDSRQPFYLCPIDQAKLRHAVAGKDADADEWESGWCERMRVVCDEFIRDGEIGGWEGFRAWLEGRYEQLQFRIGGRENLVLIGTADDPIEIE